MLESVVRKISKKGKNMKKYLSALTVLILAGLVNASTINVESGWNLISTAGISNVSTSCILNQLPKGSIIWSFDNYSKKWLAKSNSDIINSAISNHLLQFVENVNSTQGFWLNNVGGASTIDMNCTGSTTSSSSTNFVFGNVLNLTAYDMFQSGNIFFDVTGDGGYDKVIVNSQTNVTDEWYEYNGTGFVLSDTMDINITVNSDNNFSYSIANGERGDIIINEIKEILAVGDENTSTAGLKYISVTSYVTHEGIGYWDPENWTPTYYDSNSSQDVPVADIDTLKNLYINPNSGYWFGEPDNNVWMFEASSDTTITSGNIVRANYEGLWDNCTPTNEYDCKKFVRTTDVVGSWSLQNGILSVDAPEAKIEWKFESGRLYKKEIEKVGSVHNWFWLWGDDPTTIETQIRSKF